MAYLTCKSNGSYHRLTGAKIPPLRLFMFPLIAAALLGVLQPAAHAEFDPPGPDVFCAEEALTDLTCQISSFISSDAFFFPELGGSFFFVTNGQFVLGTDDGRLTGNIQNSSGDEFSVSVDFTSLMPADPNTVNFLLREQCFTDHNATIASWTQFTGTIGELVGLPGSVFAGARYAINKRSGKCSNDSSISCTVATQEADCGVSNTCNLFTGAGADAQFGFGANTHNLNLGLFAKIEYVLIEGNGEPNLPVGPFLGEISVDLVPSVELEVFPGVNQLCFAPAEPDLVGTWTGTIDCVGFDAEVNLSAEPVEKFFSAATLEIGRSTNLLDDGDQYSVRLTRETGNSQSFCAYAPNNPGSTTGGQGVLVEPQRQAIRVYFKFEGGTLKARELIADGLHGIQLCKWNLTRTSTTPPTVADACPLDKCHSDPISEQCNDNALCGQGILRNGVSTFNCTCKDGYVGGGYGTSGCTLAP